MNSVCYLSSLFHRVTHESYFPFSLPPSSEDLQSTDSEDEPDLNLMTAQERKQYLESKAKRKAEREKKRKEKYGDKYEEMKKKNKE